MKALRWHGRRDVRLEDVDLQGAPGAGMVEVAVDYCGICGSDLAEFQHGPFAIRPGPHRLTGQQPPVTLGHEFSGSIVSVGPDVPNLAPGLRVSADATWRCGHCRACQRGEYNLCPDGGSIGLASDGGFAARVRIPAYCAVPLPDQVSSVAGALIEPLSVGLHALDRGAAKAGDSVVITGFGPIGAAAAEVATAIGLAVLVVEPNARRRQRAEELGYAALSPDGEPRDVARAVRQLTGGGAPVVVECSGNAAALELAPEMSCRGGRIVSVGLPKQPVSVDAARLVLYERSLVGALGYRFDLPRIASMIDSGVLQPERLVTRTVALADAVGEFDRLAAGDGTDLKVLVRVGAQD
jgi:(R,R)-butanediol dehydrogenase / meso-butanediol dehydrogenase / diacetyl reductase